MIFFPENWKSIGKEITVKMLEQRLLEVVENIGCRNLSLSGGLDSSLMLWFMAQVFEVSTIHCYTIALHERHPDYFYANKMGKFLNVNVTCFVPPISPTDPDEIVKMFYLFVLSQGVERIIACDGIDEFMCGYYVHQSNLDEKTYYSLLGKLYEEHLKPLSQNSQQINVYLPYLDEQLILMMSQIPLVDKVDSNTRKKILVEMANGKIPKEIISRPKYGFCDAMIIKKCYEN